MKRLIVRLVCFFAALLAVPLGYFCWVQSLPAMFRGSLMGSILIKHQLAQDTPGARILVVGGSSVPYSIQCETIQQQTGMPCIAMGATAYLGLEYYLSLLEDDLHQGDLVILAPEIAMLQDQISYSTTWTAVENDPGLLAAVPLSYWPDMIANYYTYSRQKLDLYRQKGAPAQSPLEEYQAFGFGPWGDLPEPRETLLESGYDKNNILTLTGDDLAPRVSRAIQAFAKKAQAAGARVVLTWAPFDELAYTGTDAQLDALQAQLEQQTGLVYLGSLAESMLPGELFYDSNNHLTSEGATLRTETLLEDLSAAGLV